MILIAQNITYAFPAQPALWKNINVSIAKGDKAALVGDNGTGKSTFLKILAGKMLPASGQVSVTVPPFYIPQHFGQYNTHTVAEALSIDDKLNALAAIEQGKTDVHYFEVLADDWTLEERCRQALVKWGLDHVQLTDPFARFSGGEKTKIFLAGIDIHQPELILLDEPTNHLDTQNRERLYEWIQFTSQGMLIVSHDRQLLRKCHPILALSAKGIQVYGGNFDFYEKKKEEEIAALRQQIEHTEKTLKSVRKKQQETLERKQKESARGVKQKKTSGTPRIMMNAYKNAGEKSFSKLKDAHTKKVADIRSDLGKLKEQEQHSRSMQTDFENARLHKGKILVKAEHINFAFAGNPPLFQHPLTFTIHSGDRLVIAGANGSGKSTLIQLITGTTAPTEGSIYRAETNKVLIDQEYSLIDRDKTILAQVEWVNEMRLPEHEIKIRLNRFLFDKESWDKPCTTLSGGEMLRLALCSIMVKNAAPDIILLDEPTNNLDLTNIRILTETIANYQGTLIVVSHDLQFLQDIGVEKEISLY